MTDVEHLRRIAFMLQKKGEALEEVGRQAGRNGDSNYSHDACIWAQWHEEDATFLFQLATLLEARREQA